MRLNEHEVFDFPIGTRVKDNKDNDYLKIRGNLWIRQFSDIKYTNSEISKLAYKVLIPEYATLIRPETILDYREKLYLTNVIKPFRNRIKSVQKISCAVNTKEYLFFDLADEFGFSLPTFKTDTMYRNMEVNKKYTLKELEL